MSLNSQRQQQATRHEFRARNYRRQAELLLERDDDLDCAGALIYESAKQCINALSNQRGLNPTRTGNKERFLAVIAQEEPAPQVLMQMWKQAGLLHVYADRAHLSRAAFMEAWEWSQLFIDQMLLKYARNA